MTDTATTQASDVTNSLIAMIEDAAGSALTTAAKTRLTMVATILGAIGDEIAPLLESKFDVSGLLAGINLINQGGDKIALSIRSSVASAATPTVTTTAAAPAAATAGK